LPSVGAPFGVAVRHPALVFPTPQADRWAESNHEAVTP